MNKILLLSIILIFSQSMLGQSHSWIASNGDTNWFTAANWSAGTVPDNTSTVEIPDGFEVLIDTSAATANDITLLGASTLTVNANLTVTNIINISTDSHLNFTLGTIQASIIENNGLISTNTPELKDFTNTVINNHNLIKVVTSNVIRLNGNVTINNMENAVIEITANGGLIEQNNSQATLNNYGLITKFNETGGFGSFYMIVDCLNYGTLDIDTNNQFLFLNSQVSLTNMPTGILSGKGVFDITAPFINQGTVSPAGSETGTLTFVNSFNLMGGNIKIDINAPDDHDIINIVGAPFVEGDITINSHYTDFPPEEMYSIEFLVSNFDIENCMLPTQIEYSNFDGTETWIYAYNTLCETTAISLEFDFLTILDSPSFEVSKPNFNLQSNPVLTNAIFNIDTNSLSDDAVLTIYSTKGNNVETLTNLSEKTTINTAHYANGIYLAALQSQGKTATLKMLVQH